MSHPPTANIDRSLQLAIRSTRLLGIVCTVFGFVFVIAFGYFNRYEVYKFYFIAIGMIVWFVPGVLFLTCTGLMKQKLRRGAVGAFAVGMAQLFFALLALAASVRLPPISPIPVLLSLLWAAAIVQLLVHLRRAMGLLEHDVDSRRGFEVSTARTVLPVAPKEVSSPSHPPRR